MNDNAYAAPTVFETERLIAREFSPADAEAVYVYASDIENCAFMSWAPESLEGVGEFIRSRLASQIEDPRRTYDLALCLKDTGELIGAMGLYLNELGDQAEIGWVLNKRFWHKGYAAEAARGFLRFGFLGLELHRIYAKCDTENHASYALMERLGMRREACFRKDLFTRVRQKEGWRSTFVYAMLQKEYLCSLPDGDYLPANSQFVH